MESTYVSNRNAIKIAHTQKKNKTVNFNSLKRLKKLLQDSNLVNVNDEEILSKNDARCLI